MPEEKKLDILVVENTPRNQESARVLLADHNLTVVGSFDEAADYLVGGSDYTPQEFKGRKTSYDAVLTDLFLPQGRGDCMFDKSMADKKMPLGYAIALMAAKEETPYIAIVMSEGNHSTDPIAYSMDFFEVTTCTIGIPTIIQLGISKLAMAHDYLLHPSIYMTPDGRMGTEEEVGRREELEIPHPGVHTYGRTIEKDGKLYLVSYSTKGLEYVINWKAALEMLKGE